MHKIFLRDLVEKCDAKLIQGDLDLELVSFSKDTRTIKEGDIYIGIQGENFDGNTLYKEALEKKALGCILSSDTDIDKEFLNNYPNSFIVMVKDTILCIQKLASYKRSLYDIPVIGITGSVGKTSTKDIVASVLNEKFKVLKTEGNYNNHIGLPLTILKLQDEETMVLEMGMSHEGEISTLSKIARPTVAIITNVGTAHIGNLGSRENILKAKLEILDGLDNNGYLIINIDNDLLAKYYSENGNKSNIITFGIENDNSLFVAKNIKLEANYSLFSCLYNEEMHHFEINIPGTAFIYNALSAISISKIFDINVDKLKKAISNFELTKKRMDIETINGITIINDSYNANLDSMSNAINHLGTLKSRKIAVLGDMLELGEYTEKLHRDLAEIIKNNKIDIVLLVGEYTKYIENELKRINYSGQINHFNTNKEVIEYLDLIVKEKDNILIKASYSMNFEEIYKALKENLS